MNNGLKAVLVVFGVIAVLALIVIFWGVGQYNNIVTHGRTGESPSGPRWTTSSSADTT